MFTTHLEKASIQMILFNFICFLCPGMFNALNAMGGAHPTDSKLSSITNTVLYGFLIISGFIGGSIVNLVSIRWTLFASGLTYGLYTASFIFFNATGSYALTLASGPLLGIGAGILWSAQGTALMWYPSANKRSRYFSLFWTVLNMGAICGSIVLFAINFNQNYRLSYAPPPMASYIVLASLEVLGAFCALFLVPFANVHREVMCIRSYDFLDARIEAYEMLYMFRDRWILVLIPLFLVSNFFYTYQWTLVNGAIFNLRTRAFNSIIYWTSQILAAFAISFLHDYKHLPRRWRGAISLVIVTMLTCIVWGCSLAYQLVHLDSPLTGRADAATDSLIDFTQFKRSGIPTTLFFSMGVVAALWQSLAYWLIGTMSEDSAMIARYAGFHKSIQSMGAMVAWQLEAQSVSFMVQIIVNWSLVVAALPPTLYFTLNIKNERQEKYPMNFIDIA